MYTYDLSDRKKILSYILSGDFENRLFEFLTRHMFIVDTKEEFSDSLPEYDYVTKIGEQIVMEYSELKMYEELGEPYLPFEVTDEEINLISGEKKDATEVNSYESWIFTLFLAKLAHCKDKVLRRLYTIDAGQSDDYLSSALNGYA